MASGSPTLAGDRKALHVQSISCSVLPLKGFRISVDGGGGLFKEFSDVKQIFTMRCVSGGACVRVTPPASPPQP